MKLRPLTQMPTAWTGLSDRFGVHLFEGELTVADMDRMQVFGDRWYAANPGKLVELVVVFPSNTRMTHEERVRMARLIQRWETVRVASATVILADGLIGAMQRSVLTGMLMLAPPPHPSKVFGKVADAVAWLAPHVQSLCGPRATRDVVLAAVEEMCTEFRARR